MEDRMAAMRAARGKGSKMTHKGRARDRREPGEIRSRKDAVMSFCSECITAYGLDCGGHGGVAAAIRACPSTKCHLWPWRNGPIEID